jgi:AMP nucleosidase
MNLAPATIVDQLIDIHSQSVAALREALKSYINDGVAPDGSQRVRGDWAYPELRLEFSGERRALRPIRAFARLNRPGSYASTITRPAMFRAYLEEQLGLLMADYDVAISVGRSEIEIPYPYVLDGAADLNLEGVAAAELARHFPTTELQQIGDELSDGLWNEALAESLPLALFDGPRTDFSLARLKHYTGTAPEDFQHYILLTNYHRYVDEFVRWACRQLGPEGNGGYDRLACPGGLDITADDPDATRAADDFAWRKNQMPAWHLIGPGGTGVTLVNIGVGPANAKTICDHLAVLRPEAWLMIGHCGGLRPSQAIGDYVLAHAYLRDDHVLDDVLPPEIPIPALSEVQKALQLATALFAKQPAFQPEPRGCHRHGIGHHRRPGLSLPRPLRHVPVRVRQATARRDQAARPGQPLLRRRDFGTSAGRHRSDDDPARRRPGVAQPQAAGV